MTARNVCYCQEKCFVLYFIIYRVRAREIEVELETFDEEGNSVITTDTEIKGGTEVFLDIFNLDGERLYTFELAGKDVDRARIRRTKVEVSVID